MIDHRINRPRRRHGDKYIKYSMLRKDHVYLY